MADTRDSADVFWVEPRRRGILPLMEFHLPRSLARTLKRERFFHSRDLAFDAVVQSCASTAPGREQSWINATIHDAYLRLHAQGHAHSIETWDMDGRLVGGLYGVRVGAAFFGESMFSRATDASKAALAHLIARLRLGGFALLDTQFLTAHLERFGGREVRRSDYVERLAAAVSRPARWTLLDALEGFPPQPSGGGVVAGGAAGVSAAGFAVSGLPPPDFAAPEFRAPDFALPPELLGALGPSGKRIVQLLSQTS
ncbi:leucyl/phenylalanyl-tRNA--protein transferase [Sandaracinobacter sp. RS1-74]|nr:leucyl/phenylalanyl-tRNA--protein transferase [Sandaracinobacteroides sayramensis]